MNQKGLVGILAAVLAILLVLTVTLEMLVWSKHRDSSASGLQQNTDSVNTDQSQQDTQESTQEETQEETQDTTQEEAPQPLEFTLSFAGDCTLGDDYDWYGGTYGFLSVVNGDYAYPFQNTLPYFENDDFTITNKEIFKKIGFVPIIGFPATK